MRIRIPALLLATAILLSFAGCSDNITIVQPRDTSIAGVNIDPGDGEFSVAVNTAMMNGEAVDGPFVIDGTNIHYDTGIGALVVDLTVTNASPNIYPLPVHLEFVVLSPSGVTVLNSDNGKSGPGAQIEMHFTNRDVHWAPGERSQPRSVQFGVDEGVSIGFGVRVLVGEDETRGAISGVVFFDANENGLRDPGEGGIAGRVIRVMWSDSLLDCIPEIDCPAIRTATTNINGEYHIGGFDAGFYTVAIVRDRCSTHTTPSELQVILVEAGGQVGDFTAADFGVVPGRCECVIQNGDFAAGLEHWTDEGSGPGLGSGVTEIIDVDGRTDVLHVDSRAGSNYYLFRTQTLPSCGLGGLGIGGFGLGWEWKLGNLENPYGLAAVYVEFYDGADALVGRYYVRRHTGNYAAYECDALVAEHLRDHPDLFVGCEQVTGTSFGWITHYIAFDEVFFANLSGPTPGPIAAIKVVIESYNNAGSGVDAYFDNIRYEPLIPVGE